MPSILNWFLRLALTNPICMRLVQGGSRRPRHLYIRSGYLAVMIVVLLFALLSTGATGSLSMRAMASGGAQMFEIVSYLQVGLICLLTPIFMAGAITQEANPKTWDILLTTPLNNLQIVLGNLFGRLFFILALLFSSLPLFVVTQYFGGVPGKSVFASYAIAGLSALLVAVIAVTLSVTRTAGKRAVFIFYISVVMYLFITYGIDIVLRVPTTPAATAHYTTLMTPLNPFLALNVLLNSNTYVPHNFTGQNVTWLTELWMSRPIACFCWGAAWLSVLMMLFSTIRLRVIGAIIGATPWYRKLFGLGAKGTMERPARRVGTNPIVWREAHSRGKTFSAVLGRWSFMTLGMAVAVTLLLLFHTGAMTASTLQLAVGTVLAAEIVIITLIALNTSATAVSREREDGTLDIILTTPIEPGPYLLGKLRGLVQALLPLLLVPVLTAVLFALYVLFDGFGGGNPVIIKTAISGTATMKMLPVILPEAAIALPLLLPSYIAFCVMVGLHWSLKSKGTVGSVVAAVGVVGVVIGVLSLCGIPAGSGLSLPGAVIVATSPIDIVFAVVSPGEMISDALDDGVNAARISIIIGAAIAGVGYGAIVYMMHANMKRSFMMTVRRLSGSN